MQILVILYRYNKKKRTQARAVSLSGRYQYAENVAMLRVLVPAVLGYGCIHFVGLVLFMPPLVSAWFYADDGQYDLIVQVRREDKPLKFELKLKYPVKSADQ